MPVTVFLSPVISPTSPISSNNLTCNFNVTDADGDNVVNITNWYKNNESILLAYWPFEGGSNSTYTKDYSGYGNDFTVKMNGTGAWNRSQGKIGSAYILDGDNQPIYQTGVEIEFNSKTYQITTEDENFEITIETPQVSEVTIFTVKASKTGFISDNATITILNRMK